MRLPDDQAERLFAGERALPIWREHLCLSVEDLAKRTGLSADYLRKVEAGKRRLGETNARSVAGVLGIDPCELQPFASAFGHCGFALSLSPEDEERLLFE